MDDSNSSGKSRNLTYILIFVLVFIIVAILAGGYYLNYSKVNQLNRKIDQTQKDVEKVKEDTAEKKQNAMEEINPETVVRLALLKAYTSSLKNSLSKQDLADLDRITLYIQGNPSVIVTKNPDLPADVAQAIANIKLKAKALRNKAVVVIKDEVDKATYTQGEEIMLTGTISFVEDDAVYGGSIFMLTDSETGNTYYLHFNETNSQTIKNTMLDEKVTVDVKVTSKANEPLAFEVVSGPTLAKQTPTPQPTQ
jgi:flagellar basal body-associated protein FliL